MRCWNVECRVTCWVMTWHVSYDVSSPRGASRVSYQPVISIWLSMSCHMSRTRTDAHHDTPHRTRSLRFVGDWCGCCVLICDWLIEFASNLQTRTAQDKMRSLCVTAVHCLRISQWRLSGLFVLFVWVWFVLSFVWGLFFGGSVLRTECWYRRPDLSWTKESLNKICKISWEGHLLWPDLSAVYASAGCGAFVCADLAFFVFLLSICSDRVKVCVSLKSVLQHCTSVCSLMNGGSVTRVCPWRECSPVFADHATERRGRWCFLFCVLLFSCVFGKRWSCEHFAGGCCNRGVSSFVTLTKNKLCPRRICNARAATTCTIWDDLSCGTKIVANK